jgi:uncharacterized protein YfaS (alpha-2-macroglobulin family)
MNDAATDITATIIAPAEVDTSAATEATRISVKRGRPTETLEQRLARLQRQLEETKIAAKEAERRKFAVVGEALLTEAEADGAFKAHMVEILRRRVTAAGAKSDIAALLAEGGARV